MGDSSKTMNVAVIEGSVRGEPIRRQMDDGSFRLSFDIKGDDGEAPVTWFGPESKVPAVSENDRVTVIGTIRRYFYRGAAGVASRTDIVASSVVFGAGKRRRNAIVKLSQELKEQAEMTQAA